MNLAGKCSATQRQKKFRPSEPRPNEARRHIRHTPLPSHFNWPGLGPGWDSSTKHDRSGFADGICADVLSVGVCIADGKCPATRKVRRGERLAEANAGRREGGLPTYRREASGGATGTSNPRTILTQLAKGLKKGLSASVLSIDLAGLEQ